MFDRPPVKTHEVNIDQLVVEELHASADFRRWLLERLIDESDHEFIGAWQSLMTETGEADVAVGFRVDGERLIVLIEDKIYAPEQPRQEERYRERGNNLIESGDWDAFTTVLLAPEEYLLVQRIMRTS